MSTQPTPPKNPIAQEQRKIVMRLLARVQPEWSDNTCAPPTPENLERRMTGVLEALVDEVGHILAPLFVPTRALDIAALQALDIERFKRAAQLSLTTTLTIHEAWDRV